MENSENSGKNHQANQAAYERCTGQKVADAGATARRAIAITRNGLESSGSIATRALKQRDASRAEAAEAKSSLEPFSRQMHENAKACTPTDQSVRNFKDGLGTILPQHFLYISKQWYVGTCTAQVWSGVSAAWCPQPWPRLKPSRTHSSNFDVI